MTPLPLADLRDIVRHDLPRAHLLWFEGLTILASAAEAGGAMEGLEAADLSGRRMQMLTAAMPAETDAFQLPVPLVGAVRMHTGWLIRVGSDPAQNPLAPIGAALCLCTMARGMAGSGPMAVVLAHHPEGGVLVTPRW